MTSRNRCRALLSGLVFLCLTLAGWGGAWAAPAFSPELASRMASGDSDARVAAIQEAVALADPAVAVYVRHLLSDEVKLVNGKAFVVVGDKASLAGSSAAPLEGAVPEGVEDVVNNNRMRRELEGALATLSLFAPDRNSRAKAVQELKEQADASRLPLLQKAVAAEVDPALRQQLKSLVAAAQLSSAMREERLAAATLLADIADPSVRSLLSEKLASESDPQVKTALGAALSSVQDRLAWGDRLGVMFSGISLGSILMLAALGLAITYGLMGVINMAHGELMMVGAYATYMVQNVFKAVAPGWFDAYILVAIPVAFVCAAAVGALLERSVIRWLYGRPLETLLATWGISLILMQSVRSLFGAQNVAVENPSWLSGGLQVLPNLILPWNRLAILAFAMVVLLAVASLIERTRLGLFVRGVTQNRRMAACVGVHTARIDTWAFSLGAGIAGLAGCALSQIGNVGPDLGQSYIVDSFMVVVLGGVGQLAGTVYAGLGLGVLNKLLEGWQGAVLAKIMVLVFIVVFIQKRPQGLFALKGRSAES